MIECLFGFHPGPFLKKEYTVKYGLCTGCGCMLLNCGRGFIHGAIVEETLDNWTVEFIHPLFGQTTVILGKTRWYWNMIKWEKHDD